MKKLLFILSFALFGFLAIPNTSLAADSSATVEEAVLTSTNSNVVDEDVKKVEDTCILIAETEEYIIIVIFEC